MTAPEQFILAHTHCLPSGAVCPEVWWGHAAGLLHLCCCTAEQTRNGNRTQTRAETSRQLCAPFKYPFKLRRTWFKWYPGLMWVSWTSVFYSKDAFLWKKKYRREINIIQGAARCKVARHQLISVCFHSTSSDTCRHPPCPHLCCPTPRAKREQGSMASDRWVTWEQTPPASCLERKEPSTREGACWPQPAWASSWCCRPLTSVCLTGQQGASSRCLEPGAAFLRILGTKKREKKQQQELSGRMPSVRARCTLSSSKHHHENSAGSSD